MILDVDGPQTYVVVYRRSWPAKRKDYSPFGLMPVERHKPKKLLRASRACDFCHKRSIKCQSSNTSPGTCQNCVDFNVPCTYDRPLRRGRDANRHVLSDSIEAPAAVRIGDQSHTQPHARDGSRHEHVSPRRLVANNDDENAPNEHVLSRATESLMATRSLGESNTPRASMARGQKPSEEEPGAAWKAFAAASGAGIDYLIDVYLQVVYPIFPLFHQPTLLQKVRDQDYLKDRGFFASIMAVCALASARGRDGALHGSEQHATYNHIATSEIFYAAAKETLPDDLTIGHNFSYMRACALLAITSIQYGDIKALQLHLGYYFTLADIHKFHDESCWPKDITNVEVEERRRLYWSTYTLDVYASIVWNGIIHARGTNAKVRYPSEVEEDLITHFATLPSPQPTSSWLRGWNFTTDLYLVLEQATSILRAKHDRIDNRIDIAALFGTPVSSSATVLASVNTQFAALPNHFKYFAPSTGDRTQDIFGFQAANIQATMLLLRMVFLCADDDRRNPPDVQLKCNVAAELLAVFKTIPTAYLCGISTPLIYHLAGIGTILGSVMESPLSEIGYEQVRSMLLSIADLLESLESGLSRAANISKGLRAQVEKMDEYMRGQRRRGRSFDGEASAVLGTHQQRPLVHDEHLNMDSVGVIDDAGGAHMSGVMGSSTSGEAEMLNEWPGELQLPPELLEGWPWPFNLQSESWSFLGSV
ncbi:hypothetical protein FB567DRAFT_524321 [Paraphoma chrysanthemicola]|uniref:Zn(2)-C6 fungal-type domain-containing protein n=1 Tax=Paraphoma chrysanthemicola TaxID=798071 RepID=A0A8K0R7U5_9PLEO|nr:hypothetical protein FB567DRAFT_524321 [Paraphoma chrysanthemicola]